MDGAVTHGDELLSNTLSLQRFERTAGQLGSSVPLVRPESLHVQAYDYLKSAIIAGEIEPDRLYSVHQFATLLGVSRTPVREALLLLSQQGMLVMDRSRGFRVQPLTSSDLAAIIAIRRLLEIPAMEQLAALQPPPSTELARARQIYAELQDAADRGDLLRFLTLDRRFHLALVDGLGNGRLTRLIGELRDQTLLPGIRRITELGKLHAQGPEHFTLLRAVEDGDPVLARQTMSAHLDRTQADWG
jgi:DNA-binding GntR family transcriptional regulator